MNSSQPPISDPDKLSEQIVAYLDGELSAGERRELEERLARDPKFREQLNSYRRAWDLLDELPTTTAGERFVASTVEMVAVNAARTETPSSPRDLILRGRPWNIVLLGLGMSLLLGYVVVAATASLLAGTETTTAANEQLLVDLPVIDRVETYQHIDDIDFLRRLADSGLFDTSAESLMGGSSAIAGSDLLLAESERRTVIESFPDDAKRVLARKRQLFGEKPAERQQQIRELHRAIEAQDDAGILLATAAAYARWLGEVEWERRVELMSLPAGDRITAIHDAHNQARPAAPQRLTDMHRQLEDMHTIMRWLGRFASEHEQQVVKNDLRLRRRLEKTDSERVDRRALSHSLLRYWIRTGKPKNPDLDQMSLDKLVRSLSSELQKQVQAAGTVSEQWSVLLAALQSAHSLTLSSEQLREWRNLSVAKRMEEMLQAERRPPKRYSSGGNKRELWRYFDQRLTDEERAEMEKLPPKEILRQLRRRMQNDEKFKQEADESRDRFDRPGKDFPDAGPDRRRGPRRGPPFNRPPPRRRGGESIDDNSNKQVSADDEEGYASRRPPRPDRGESPSDKRDRRPPPSKSAPRERKPSKD